ncbi:hypothetical protein KKC91_07590 [bacterium]|nr:hypothetical protein [bacterium]
MKKGDYYTLAFLVGIVAIYSMFAIGVPNTYQSVATICIFYGFLGISFGFLAKPEGSGGRYGICIGLPMFLMLCLVACMCDRAPSEQIPRFLAVFSLHR